MNNIINWPACDSAPGLDPNPPSKFRQDFTKSAALSTSNSDSLPTNKSFIHYQNLIYFYIKCYLVDLKIGSFIKMIVVPKKNFHTTICKLFSYFTTPFTSIYSYPVMTSKLQHKRWICYQSLPTGPPWSCPDQSATPLHTSPRPPHQSPPDNQISQRSKNIIM